MPKPKAATTLILSAMPSEIRLIQAQISRPKSGRLAGFPYVTGMLCGRRVVTAVTGVGVTNGAMVTALFIQAFGPAEVLVSGTGSRLNPRLATGDTIISTKTIHHAAGSLTDRGMVYRKVRGPLAGQMTHWYYRPDRRLLKLARAAIAGYTAAPVTANGTTYVPGAHWRGGGERSVRRVGRQDRRPAQKTESGHHGDGERRHRPGLHAARRAAHRIPGRQQPDAGESRQRLPPARPEGRGRRGALDGPFHRLFGGGGEMMNALRRGLGGGHTSKCAAAQLELGPPGNRRRGA